MLHPYLIPIALGVTTLGDIARAVAPIRKAGARLPPQIVVGSTDGHLVVWATLRQILEVAPDYDPDTVIPRPEDT